MGFPDRLIDGGWRAGFRADFRDGARSWQYFLIANLIEILPSLIRGADYRVSLCGTLQ